MNGTGSGALFRLMALAKQWSKAHALPMPTVEWSENGCNESRLRRKLDAFLLEAEVGDIGTD